ncbi:MAG: hypothetical protein CMO74_02915 [Verrucomicrobiales bacterium]|nr:hypothetical protein [Verrucomicrobiales bacterium]|tara:strand:- start:1094 stop:1465 length:372 start_codon:yes stop_codon:yes gene_type:complete
MNGWMLLLVLLLFASCGSQPKIVGKWEVASGGGQNESSGLLGGMGDLIGGMKVYTFKNDGTGSVRLGSANEPFEWKIDGNTLTRTATKTTAIMKQRVITSTFQVDDDKLTLTEAGQEVVLKRK